MDAGIWMTPNAVEAVITLSYLVVILRGAVGAVYFGRRSMEKTI